MNMRNKILGLIALLAVALTAAPSFAAQQMLCSTSAVARKVTNTASTASPQPTYSLNARGCGLIAQADIGFFLSQGYTVGPNENSIIYTTGVQASGTGDLIIGSIPAGAYIQQIIVNETAAAAVTGGIDIGTAANGQQVVAAGTVGASALIHIFDAALLKRVFSTTAATPLHLAAHTGWNGANLTVTVVYGYF